MAEYHKLIYHQRPTELQQMVVHHELRKDVADGTWCPNADNATQFGFEWHFGFENNEPGSWGSGWDGYIVDVEPNGFGSQRWRVNPTTINDVPEIECEEV